MPEGMRPREAARDLKERELNSYVNEVLGYMENRKMSINSAIDSMAQATGLANYPDKTKRQWLTDVRNEVLRRLADKDTLEHAG